MLEMSPDSMTFSMVAVPLPASYIYLIRMSLGGRAHIGISNVRSRLKEMVDGSLDIESSDEGTTATIRIPWTEGGST